MLKVPATVLTPEVLESCQQIYFRQSMIGDLLTCPQMAMYRWVLNLQESEPFFAAILGNAGHQMVYEMHTNRKFDYSYLELLTMFSQFFHAEIAKLDTLPNIGTKWDSIEEEFNGKSADYVQMLESYQKDDRNKTFYSTINEQSFVLEVEDPAGGEPYLFAGQLDQAGFNEDGRFVLRDLKFRDNAFRPSRDEFNQNPQMTIYAAALRHGQPVCKDCKPVYEHDSLTGDITLVYSGPCNECKKLMMTDAWPARYAERCELIWMYDYKQRTKDEFPKEIMDRDAPRIGRKYQRKINPEWMGGYKKGDKKGPGFILTYRPEERIQVFMSNVLQICENVRRGHFWRRPSNACNFWCKYKEQCYHGNEAEVEEAGLYNVQSYASEDGDIFG